MDHNIAVTIPIHKAVPGRVRLHVSGLKNSKPFKKYLERSMRNLSGVRAVLPSVITGNMLVLFEPALDSNDLLDQIDARVRTLSAEQIVQADFPAASAKGREKFRHRQDNRSGAHAMPASSGEADRPGTQESEVWHNKSPQEIEKTFATSITTGLSSRSAQQRLADYGSNALSEFPPRTTLSIFINQFVSWPVGLLSASAAIALLTGGVLDAAIIMGVVVTNALIGTATECNAERTIGELSHFTYEKVPVIRDGERTEVMLEEVAIGDVLVLLPGHHVAADARVVNAAHLTVDESALTGESMPVDKHFGLLDGNAIAVADRVNMVYRGTLIMGGSGLAIVVATGAVTQIGRIQHLVGHTPPRPTPMQRQLDKMGTDLVILCSGVCAVVFVLGLLRGQSFLAMFQSAISLAVAAVPEGLPTVATSSLALGVQDMRKHGVLVRQLDAVEALGAVQVICLDKTGTLTQNHMQVVSAHIENARITIEANSFYLNGERFDPLEHSGFFKLLQLAVLCNDSVLADNHKHCNNTARGGFNLCGSPTENALLELAIAAKMNIAMLRASSPRLHTHYRSEYRQHMITFHEGESARLAAVKGSPGDVLKYCGWKQAAGGIQPLSESDREEILTANNAMAGEGLRVLGIAYWPNPTTAKLESIPLIWVGLVGMQDPIRQAVVTAVQGFHRAGIKTVMITGDQSATAYSVGKALSLNGGSQIKIFDSTELERVGADALIPLAQQAQVFARVSPRNKLQIVQALQRTGQIVAMTGDGINDSPALKAADVGVAMGGVGSEAARTVADVVLENDELETLLIAVARGRTIYNNIGKSLHFLVATNISEILVMLGSIAAGLGQPLTPMQLLWINLITDIFPGLALSLEPPEPDILQRPPRDPHEPILKPRDLKRAAIEAGGIGASALGAYGYGIWRYGGGPHAGTLAFNTLTIAQLLHAASCRSENKGLFTADAIEPNPYLNKALVGSFTAQILVSLIPGLRRILGTTPLRLADLPVVGICALLPYLLAEAKKPRSALD